MAIFLAHKFVRACTAVLTDLDRNSRRNYQALRKALSLWFGNGG